MDSHYLTAREINLINQTVLITLENLGLKKTIISRAEIIRLYGRNTFEKARNSPAIKWIKKGGRTSSIFCNRSQFDSFLNTIQLD